MEDMPRSESWGEGRQHRVFMSSPHQNLGMSPFQPSSVFTNQEELLSFGVQGFYMGLHDMGMIE